MLYADKRALQTNLKVSLLAIRERELVFYTHNSLAIGTQAAMFAGFAFGGLTQPLPEEASLLRAITFFLSQQVSCDSRLASAPPPRERACGRLGRTPAALHLRAALCSSPAPTRASHTSQAVSPAAAPWVSSCWTTRLPSCSGRGSWRRV